VTGGGPRPARRPSRLELLSVVAAVVPIVVAVVRAAVTDWMPVGDAAYFTVRSRDVLTAHHPLVGAWSSGSAVVGVAVNNVGPLQLDVLAPFTKVSPYLGTAVGAAFVNAASVVIVWFVARRLFRPAVLGAVMVGTMLFEAALGLSWLIDARPQYALVLPFYALLWLSAAMWAGVGAAVPTAVVVTSLTVQSHLTYAYQSAIVFSAGLAAFVVVTWRTRRQWPTVAAWSAALAAVCWAQPLIDQFAGTGNLGRVLGPARDRPGAGIGASAQLVAGAALTPPFWSPASMRTFLLPDDGIGPAAASAAVVVWLLLAAVVAGLGARQAAPAARAIGPAGVVALGACLVGAAQIPVSMFGLVPQNYYWAWSLAAFLSIALASAAVSLPPVAATARRRRSSARRVAFAAAALVAVGVAVWPRYPVASVAYDEAEARRVGRPLRAQLAAAIDAGAVGDEVEVDLSRAFFGNDHPYVLLAELQRAGIEFRFLPDSRNLHRFGRSRCSPTGRLPRMLLISGPAPRLAGGSEVVAAVEGMSAEDHAEHLRLQQRFGDLLRHGAIEIDTAALARLGDGDAHEQLRAVLVAPDRPADGLARHLDRWRRAGIVSIPESEHEAFARLFDLEQRSSADFQTVVVERPGTGDGRPC
jgi:hypothetical protein